MKKNKFIKYLKKFGKEIKKNGKKIIRSKKFKAYLWSDGVYDYYYCIDKYTDLKYYFLLIIQNIDKDHYIPLCDLNFTDYEIVNNSEEIIEN